MKTIILSMIAFILIMMLSNFKINAQATVSGNAGATGDFLGWDNTGTNPDVQIKHELDQPIRFYTLAGHGTFNNQRMIIANNTNNGYIGFGLNFSTPMHLIDVDGGDINLNTTTSSFMIAGAPILWHNGNPVNIFVGFGAGNSSLVYPAATNTTLVGCKAGDSLNIDYGDWNNTFIGCYSGAHAYTDGGNPFGCSWNTGVGVGALRNTNAYGCSALGFNAGNANTYGCSLTAIGEDAAESNTVGNDNCAFGHRALDNNTSLSNNVAIGSEALGSQAFPATDCNNEYFEHGCASSYNVAVGNNALYNTNPSGEMDNVLNNGMNNTALGHAAGATAVTGYNNLFLGYKADVGSSSTGINNAAAIGANAIVINPNQMILGDNNLKNVGIGYSGTSGLPPGLLSVYAVSGTNAGANPTGVYASTYFGNNAVGAISIGNWAEEQSIGVNAIGRSCWQDNYGVYADAEANPFVPGPMTYGIYATYNAYGHIGAAGYFNGDVYCVNLHQTSDSILKDSVQSLTNALSIINQLNPKSFYFKVDSFPTMNLASGKQYGLIAQQVATVLPTLIDSFIQPQPEDSLGNRDTTAALVHFKALNYTGFIPFLIGGEQQLSQSIDSLRIAVDTVGQSIGYQVCSALLAPSPPSDLLPGNIQMDFNGYNIYHSGQDTSYDRIGIGYSCGDVLPAKLSVLDSAGTVSKSIAAYFSNSDNATNTATGVKVNVAGTSANEIGILDTLSGTVSNNATGLKLYVNGNVSNDAYGEYIDMAAGADDGYGIYVNAAAGGDAYLMGALISVEDVDGNDLWGTYSRSIYGDLAYGGYFESLFPYSIGIGVYGDAFESGGDSYGGQFYSSDSYTTGVGVYAYTDGSGSSANYGIWAVGPSGGDSATASSNAAAYLEGDVAYTGNLYQVSDAQLKDSVQPLQNAMATINKLNPKSYTFKTKDYPQISLPSGTQYGLIAQDVDSILPQLVKNFKALPPVDSATHTYDPNKVVNVKELNYTGFIPFLIQGMKEQQQTIDSLNTANNNTQSALDSLRSQLAQLQSIVSNCCAQSSPNSPDRMNSNPSNGGSGSNTIPVDLRNAILLEQNSPNPFKEHTTISYNLTPDVTDAQIIFYDNLGHILRSVVVTERGPGMLDVYAGNLSSGIYSYSLIADGKVIDTKHMVCAK